MLLHNRRIPTEDMKKQAAALSATLAEVMYKHLTEYTSGSSLASTPNVSSATNMTLGDSTFLYAYHTVMIGLITFLLFDGKNILLSALLRYALISGAF